jgi:hypothetical protein
LPPPPYFHPKYPRFSSGPATYAAEERRQRVYCRACKGEVNHIHSNECINNYLGDPTPSSFEKKKWFGLKKSSY